jgi:hypothetical protein
MRGERPGEAIQAGNGKRKLFLELARGEEGCQAVLALPGDDLKAAAKRFSIKGGATLVGLVSGAAKDAQAVFLLRGLVGEITEQIGGASLGMRVQAAGPGAGRRIIAVSLQRAVGLGMVGKPLDRLFLCHNGSLWQAAVKRMPHANTDGRLFQDHAVLRGNENDIDQARFRNG